MNFFWFSLIHTGPESYKYTIWTWRTTSSSSLQHKSICLSALTGLTNTLEQWKHSWNSVKKWESRITQVGKVSLRHFSTTSGFNSISSNCVTTFPRCGGRPIWSPSEEIAWDVHEAPRLKPAMSCWTVLLSNSEASLISLWTERVLTKKEAPALVETFKLSWMKFAKPSGEKFYG